MVRHAFELARSRQPRTLLSLLLIALFVSCKPPSRGSRLSPLHAAGWLVDLDVPGFGKAKLAVPLGATTPRAIVIALHGAADRPEWACSALRSLAGPAPFVLCPRGVQRTDFPATDPRYTFATPEQTASELRAALVELKRQYGEHVAVGPVIFSGVEVGADHAAAIANQEPAFFSRVLLVDPSPASWPSSQAALFGRAGGRRALFAFGPAHRDELAQKAVLTARSGAEARSLLLSDPPRGLDPVASALIRNEWPWLAAPLRKSPTIDNIAGNPLSVKGPTAPPLTQRPKP